MKALSVVLFSLISGSASPTNPPPPPAASQPPPVQHPSQSDPELARLEREAQRVLQRCNSPPPPMADDAKFTAEIARLRAIVQAGAAKQRKCGQKWQRAVPPKLAQDYLKYLEWQDEWLGKLMERIQSFRGSCGGTISAPSPSITSTGTLPVAASGSTSTGQTVEQPEQLGTTSLGSLRVRRVRHHHRSSQMAIQGGVPLQNTTTVTSGQLAGSGGGGLLIGARGGGSMQGITSGAANSGQASGLSAGVGYRSGGGGLIGRQVQTSYYGRRTIEGSNGSYGQAGGTGSGGGQASLSISGSFSRPVGSSSSTLYRSGGSYSSGGYRTGGGSSSSGQYRVSQGGSNISASGGGGGSAGFQSGGSSSISSGGGSSMSSGGSSSMRTGGSSSMRTGGSYYRSGGSSAQGGSTTTGGSQTMMGSSASGSGQSAGTVRGSTQAAGPSAPPRP